MLDTHRHGESLHWAQFYGATIQFDDQLALDYVEELILGVVFVPVELTLKDAEPDDGIVDPAEGLVEPRVGSRRDDRLEVDPLAVGRGPRS